MLNARRLLALLLAVCPVAHTADPPPARIEVFYDAATAPLAVEAVRRELPDVPIALYDLNAPDALEKELSRGLPADLEQAKAIALKRIEAMGRDALQERFAAAYRGHVKAVEYGLDRYPAVVFDGGESVVYGVRDLREALALYRRAKEVP